MAYTHPSEIMDEIARLTPTFAGVSYDKLDGARLGAVALQREGAAGTPVMHIDGFVRGKGKFVITEYVPTDEKHRAALPAAADHRAASSASTMSARRPGAPRMSSGTRRTVLEIHPHDAEQRGVRDGDWVKLKSRAGETTLRALITDRVAPGVVYTTFHHPDTQANVVTTDYSDWATNCPEYKVTAVQVSPVQRADRMAGAAITAPDASQKAAAWTAPVAAFSGCRARIASSARKIAAGAILAGGGTVGSGRSACSRFSIPQSPQEESPTRWRTRRSTRSCRPGASSMPSSTPRASSRTSMPITSAASSISRSERAKP
jgi:formylmethanofuran dehydrogenase subunit D